MSKLKVASLVLLLLAGLSIALGAIYVSGENQKYQDAKDEATSAESVYTDALDFYIAAEAYSESAWFDYDWCYYWCLDEMAAALAASDVLDSASAEISAAESALSIANNALDVAASSFNTSAAISGTGAGVLVVAATVVTVISRKKQTAIMATQDSSNKDPNWFCVECGAANELGLFCIDCGASKNETKQVENGPEENLPETSDSESSIAKAKPRKTKAAAAVEETPELPKGDE